MPTQQFLLHPIQGLAGTSDSGFAHFGGRLRSEKTARFASEKPQFKKNLPRPVPARPRSEPRLAAPTSSPRR